MFPNMRNFTIVFFAVIFAFATSNVLSQTKPKPELMPSDLKAYTHYFDIKDGKLVGGGADFLKKEAQTKQYFLLGEYHGSYRISEFTKILIPLLHDNGYRYFGLEIGPISNKIVTELSKDSAKTVENLRKFNNRYFTKTPRRNFTSIPFFSNVEDAEFLAEATKRDWKLIGLDQEFVFSYIHLLDRMFENLSKSKKKKLKEKHVAAVNEITRIGIESKWESEQFPKIYESKIINGFLNSASKNSAKNLKISKAFRKTTEIYQHAAFRRWYLQNSERIDYMKKNLREAFALNKFDLKKDKMLLKMGGVHTGKGFSPLSLWEIGNTLHELAKFHGNDSLHVNFRSRFYTEKGKVIDELQNKKGFTYRFKPLLQMANQDKWTIIDLRPMRSKYYHFKFKLDVVVLDLFKLHDIIIIPKLDKDPTPNFDLRK